MKQDQEITLSLLLKVYDLIQSSYSNANQATTMFIAADGVLIGIATQKNSGFMLILGGLLLFFLGYLLFKGGIALGALFKSAHRLEQQLEIENKEFTYDFLTSFRDQDSIKYILGIGTNGKEIKASKFQKSFYNPLRNKSIMIIIILGIFQIIIGVYLLFDWTSTQNQRLNDPVFRQDSVKAFTNPSMVLDSNKIK